MIIVNVECRTQTAAFVVVTAAVMMMMMTLLASDIKATGGLRYFEMRAAI
jgi:hypothetical protein